MCWGGPSMSPPKHHLCMRISAVRHQHGADQLGRRAAGSGGRRAGGGGSTVRPLLLKEPSLAFSQLMILSRFGAGRNKSRKTLGLALARLSGRRSTMPRRGGACRNSAPCFPPSLPPITTSH